MKCYVLAALLLIPQSALAQTDTDRTIQVTGTGIVRTDPDLAMLQINLRGEGETPDAATTDLVAKQRAVTGGLLNLLGTDSELTAGHIDMMEVRGDGCGNGRGYGGQPRLSTGDCAVVGAIATMQMNVRTRAVDKAGTAVGLASRLGASNARIQGFALSDPDEAQGRASAVAIRAARQRAEAVAAGAGLRLGPILSMRDPASIDITVSGARAMPAAPPPPPPPPPIAIDIKPQPIETRAQVFVNYAIAQ